VSDDDGTGSSTQVSVARSSWAPVAMYYHARHLMPPLLEAPALVAPTWYRKPLGEAPGSLRASRVGGKRWSGLTGGETLSAQDY
jgi:hypothetical protein